MDSLNEWRASLSSSSTFGLWTWKMTYINTKLFNFFRIVQIKKGCPNFSKKVVCFWCHMDMIRRGICSITIGECFQEHVYNLYRKNIRVGISCFTELLSLSIFYTFWEVFDLEIFLTKASWKCHEGGGRRFFKLTKSNFDIFNVEFVFFQWI